MLQVARLAPNLLQDAADRVAAFAAEQFAPEGGARDRAGTPDLYYTVFALECLVALRRELPVERVRPWLERFGDGEGLDVVHLSCLARCWAAMPKPGLAEDVAHAVAGRIVEHAMAEGGIRNVYHGFLALGALQDLGIPIPDPEEVVKAVLAMQDADGSFGRTTPTTAGAVTVLRNLGAPVPAGATDWLLERAHPKGGFTATPGAPIPDLLSTATALHALAGQKVPLAPIKEACLDFIDTLWTGKGFCGSWSDDVVDVEYTYYALLSLGHLSL
jgi:hypothetical protein